MTYTVNELCTMMDEYAPRALASEGDPIGLYLGSESKEVRKLFLALEMTPEVVAEALAFQADLVVVHHNLFKKPFSRLLDDSGFERMALDLIRAGTALYASHTNLDCARGGVNEQLTGILGVLDCQVLKPAGDGSVDVGMGRIGKLAAPMSLAAFARLVAARLHNETTRCWGPKDKTVSVVACCGGNGTSLIPEAIKRGADVYMTGDIGHHDGLFAKAMGLAVVDAGHFATENLIMPVLASYFAEKAPNLDVRVSEMVNIPWLAK